MFTDADYDMSIVAHVEPRDIRAVFGDPSYYPRYDNPEFRELLEQADTGTQEEQVTAMQDAAELLSEDAAGDWLFLLPNLMVADADITGLPENAIGEALDLTELGRSGDERDSSRGPPCPRASRRSSWPASRESVLVFAFMAVLPGDPARVALGVNASEEAVPTCAPSSALDRPLATQYLDWVGGLLTGPRHVVRDARPPSGR